MSASGSEVPDGALLASRQFRMALIKKYITFEYAWYEMDLNDDGRLQFGEFVRACRRIKTHGNLAEIFHGLTGGAEELLPEKLDPGLPAKLEARRLAKQKEAEELKNEQKVGYANVRNPHMTLMEVMTCHTVQCGVGAGPPREAKAFRDAMLKKYGKFEYAWPHIDTNDDGELSYNEFVRCCRRLHFSGNLLKIFEELSEGQKFISAASLDPSLPAKLGKIKAENGAGRAPSKETRKRIGVGVYPGAELWAGHDYTCPRGESRTLAEMHTRHQDGRNLRPNLVKAPPTDNPKTFKAALVKKYRRLDVAWLALDENHDGVLQYSEFVKACRRIQFAGNLKRVYEELVDGDEECLTADHLDPGLAAKVERLQLKQQLDGGGSPVSPSRMSTRTSVRSRSLSPGSSWAPSPAGSKEANSSPAEREDPDAEEAQSEARDEAELPGQSGRPSSPSSQSMTFAPTQASFRPPARGGPVLSPSRRERQSSGGQQANSSPARRRPGEPSPTRPRPPGLDLTDSARDPVRAEAQRHLAQLAFLEGLQTSEAAEMFNSGPGGSQGSTIADSESGARTSPCGQSAFSPTKGWRRTTPSSRQTTPGSQPPPSPTKMYSQYGLHAEGPSAKPKRMSIPWI